MTEISIQRLDNAQENVNTDKFLNKAEFLSDFVENLGLSLGLDDMDKQSTKNIFSDLISGKDLSENEIQILLDFSANDIARAYRKTLKKTLVGNVEETLEYIEKFSFEKVFLYGYGKLMHNILDNGTEEESTVNQCRDQNNKFIDMVGPIEGTDYFVLKNSEGKIGLYSKIGNSKFELLEGHDNYEEIELESINLGIDGIYIQVKKGGKSYFIDLVSGIPKIIELDEIGKKYILGDIIYFNVKYKGESYLYNLKDDELSHKGVEYISKTIITMKNGEEYMRIRIGEKYGIINASNPNDFIGYGRASMYNDADIFECKGDECIILPTKDDNLGIYDIKNRQFVLTGLDSSKMYIINIAGTEHLRCFYINKDVCVDINLETLKPRTIGDKLSSNFQEVSGKLRDYFLYQS